MCVSVCWSVWLVPVMVGEPPCGYRGYLKGPVWSSLNVCGEEDWGGDARSIELKWLADQTGAIL